jgi:biopolymer transport protein ExbD
MKFRRSGSDDPEVNLIPLIDVLLVVLIFLAVSTSYARFSQLNIELPSAATNPSVSQPVRIAVGVSADGRLQIDHTIVPVQDQARVADLLRKAAAGQADAMVVINADAQAPHQSVVTVMEASRDAGISHLGFATQEHANHRGHP